MGKWIRNLHHRLLRYINNKSLAAKFSAIFIFSVLIPVVLSCAIFSYNMNRNFYAREMDNLAAMAQSKAEELNTLFDDAVTVSNVIANDSVVRDVAELDFGSPIEYYNYIIEHDFKDYFQIYIEQKKIIRDVIAYVDNDTITNGGIVWKLDDEIRKSGWCRTAQAADKNIIMCYDDQSAASDSLCIVRKLGRGKTERIKIGYIKIFLNMNELRRQMLTNTDYMSFYLAGAGQDLLYDPKTEHILTMSDYKNNIAAEKGNVITEQSISSSSYLKEWKVVAVYNKSRIDRQSLVNIAFVVLINLLIALLMIGVIYTVFRSYNERISKLRLSMRDVERENFNEITGDYGGDEIGKLTGTYNHMIRKINKLINDNYKLELEKKDIELEKIRAELNALQSQINPHFIFNVLNAMLIFSVKNGYSEITPQISGLAKMIRRLLDWGDDLEPLSKEADFLDVYLQLEKFRFGDIFDYDIEIEPGAESCLIPKMMIQPIIENACKHGLHSVSHERYLKVYARLDDNVLTVSVKDNGIGISEERLKEITDGLADDKFDGHIGIKNVYRRLKLFYGETSDLSIISTEGEGTEVIITIDYNE